MIKSRQELAEYALRQLGAPVINIEVADEQIEDCVELAIQYYHEYHFDGIDRDYLVHKITGSSITVADGTKFTKGDKVTSLDGNTTAMVEAIAGNVLTTNRQIGFDKFQKDQVVKSGNTGQQTTITAITLGDVDNGWIPAAENIVGVKKILNITSVLGSSDYMFNVQYQIMLSEMQNLTKAGTSYFYGVMQYLGHLDFLMKKEKDFRFNRRMNRLYLDVAWGSDIKAGDIVVAEIYRAIDDAEYSEVLDDIWLKKYTTSLIKKMWGTNLRKYQNMQLPGGITFNGQVIYDEAITELKDLEAEAIYSTSPLEFMTG